MKKIVIAGFLVLLISSFSLSKECLSVYNELMTYYATYSKSPQGTFKYRLTTFKGGQSSSRVEKHTYKGIHARMESNELIHNLDSKVSVLIIKPQKMILLRSSEGLKKEDKDKFSPSALSLDSLSKMYPTMECSSKGDVISFSADVNQTYQKGAKVKSTKVILKGNRSKKLFTSSDYYSVDEQGNEIRLLYEYLYFRSTIDIDELKSKALDEIYLDGKLKEEYRNYQVRDLRGE